MAKNYLVGVDVGTQGTKAAVFTLDGKMVGSGFTPSQLHQPHPGVTEEDPQIQYQAVCNSITAALSSGGVNPADVAAVAMDGQMAGVIGIDEEGQAVTPYDSWLDTRCGPYIREMLGVGGKRVTELTGNAPSFNHGPKILWWKHEQPDVYARIARFVQPTGYAALRLTGGGAGEAFIDYTYLHFSGFADTKNAVWSQELLDLFDVEQSRMPQIVSPTDLVGTVCKKGAEESGLAEGTPVFAGCGDTAASFLAAGAVDAGISIDVSGTASVFAATTDSMTPDTIDGMLGVGRSVIPGLWHPYAYVNGGGMNLEWFRNMLSRIKGDKVPFKEINRMARDAVKTETSPLFVPHLAGRVSPSNPDLRGAWLGLDWTHDVGHLYGAILEGVALEYRLYKQRLADLSGGDSVRELRNTGGGNTSTWWKQVKADALGVRVIDIPDFAGATHGVAMIAGVGAGILPDLAEASREWISTGPVTEPNGEMSGYYEKRMALYELALDATQKFAIEATGVN